MEVGVFHDDLFLWW